MAAKRTGAHVGKSTLDRLLGARRLGGRTLGGLFAAGLLVVALGGLDGCRKSGGEKKVDVEAQPVLTVSSMPVATRKIEEVLEFTGAISAWEPLPVSPAANGLQVMRVLVNEGSRVRKGQELARLDDRTILSQLVAAQARASTAAAQLAKARVPNRPQDIQTLRAALAQSESAVTSSRDVYLRYRSLAGEGGISASDLIARQTALAGAEAAADQARARLSLALAGSRSEDLRIAEAAAAEARASVQQFQLQLAQTRVTAPAGGVIIKKDVLMGDVSSLVKPMFTLMRDDRMQMDANVPENDAGKIRVGQQAGVTSDARPDLHATGRVREIRPIVSATSRQADAQIDLPSGNGFRVGMFARARIRVGARQVLAVPADAVTYANARPQIFVLSGDVVHARLVDLGQRDAGWIAIRSGLRPGEPVVTDGVGFLKDGDKVTLAAKSSGGAPAGAAPGAPAGGASRPPAGGAAASGSPAPGHAGSALPVPLGDPRGSSAPKAPVLPAGTPAAHP